MISNDEILKSLIDAMRKPFDDEILRLRTTNTVLLQRARTAEHDTGKLIKQCRQLTAENTDLESQSASLQGRLSHSSAECDRLRKKVDVLTANYIAVTQQLAAITQQASPAPAIKRDHQADAYAMANNDPLRHGSIPPAVARALVEYSDTKD